MRASTSGVKVLLTPRLANEPTIPPSPWDPQLTNYVNRSYNPSQQVGQYLQTVDRNSLTAVFQTIASSLLRISQ